MVKLCYHNHILKPASADISARQSNTVSLLKSRLHPEIGRFLNLYLTLRNSRVNPLVGYRPTIRFFRSIYNELKFVVAIQAMYISMPQLGRNPKIELIQRLLLLLLGSRSILIERNNDPRHDYSVSSAFECVQHRISQRTAFEGILCLHYSRGCVRHRRKSCNCMCVYA